ncbi:unnamed protein product [Ixodes persulcatus]
MTDTSAVFTFSRDSIFGEIEHSKSIFGEKSFVTSLLPQYIQMMYFVVSLIHSTLQFHVYGPPRQKSPGIRILQI